MSGHEALENPVWAALTSTHAEWAQTMGELKRFGPEVAPFCAVAHAGAAIGVAHAAQPGEVLYFVGASPPLPPDWELLLQVPILQMVYGGVAAPGRMCAPAAVLSEADVGAMRALTALVYPEYFRPRTASLGKYIGLHEQGELVAMAGQRLALTGYREISAVCTHPGHRGRGHARRLIEQLTGDILEEGRTPFLHVSASNESARALYQELGFLACREIMLTKVRAG